MPKFDFRISKFDMRPWRMPVFLGKLASASNNIHRLLRQSNYYLHDSPLLFLVDRSQGLKDRHLLLLL
eukprot:12931795-Prorocentrum_lima.AAC.1